MALSASDLPMMYQLLANSLSSDQIVRKPAETALSQSESRPGLCSWLLTIFLLYNGSDLVFVEEPEALEDAMRASIPGL